MKCSACGRDFDEGFPYCPWCGSSATTTQEAGNLRRIAVQERLRELRSNTIASYVGGGVGLVAGVFLAFLLWTPPGLAATPAWVQALIAFVIVWSCVILAGGYRYYRKWQDLVRKLEKGRSE